MPGDKEVTHNFMGQFNRLLLKAARRPLASAWLLFFAYAAGVALSLQLVVLPFWFPALHAGNGLLIGGDWVGIHQLGVALSQKILSQGWTVWELSPFGHPPAGMAAAFYALTVPQPYVLIPMNATLHATAGVAVMQIVRLLTNDDRIAFYAALPFVLFPSAMAWYAQIQKDGFYFAGAYLCLYGWIVLARLSTWHSGGRLIFFGLMWVGLGLVLMGSVRIYSFQLMQGIGIIFAAGLTALFIARGVKGQLSWKKCGFAIVILCLIPLLLKLAPLETRGTSQVPEDGRPVGGVLWHGAVFASEKWQPTAGLPRFIENSFLRIAVLRNGYFTTLGYDASGSMIDRHIELLNVKDFLMYMPRALQLGLFAPFPSDWVGPAKSSGGALMRRLAGLEMVGVYFALALLPYAIWRWRSRVEFWLTASFGSILLLLYSYATPNIGSLYRLRYGFLMLLVALGVAGALAAWRDFRNSPRITLPSKG